MADERHIEEEDALLTGQQQTKHKQVLEWSLWQKAGLFAWATIATALAIILAVLYQHKQNVTASRPIQDLPHYSKPTGKRNLIFMVSDGMGPTSLSLTRSFLQTQQDYPYNHTLTLDTHLIGSSRTRSSSSLITDSAAGATAFSCAHKSYNGAISILPDGQICGTVMEAAKRAGYTTGLVVTTRITDATPACFVAHVNTRGEEDSIAEQEIGPAHPFGRMVDLIMGGGRCHFLPNSTSGSCRADGKDLVRQAEGEGWNYVSDRNGFDALDHGKNIKLPLLGLFADTDIPYEIDRAQQSDVYPSLSEMTEAALSALAAATRDTEQGFFIMIEGSRIDHAGHGNDPVAQVHEVIEYDKAFSKVLSFLDQETDVPGILVSTSDHETGGLATARQLHETYPQYRWFPDTLVRANHSASHLAKQLHEHADSHVAASSDALKTWIESQLVQLGLGIMDASDTEIQALVDAAKAAPSPSGPSASYLFADMISRRAQVGWSTHGHSAADVNIYASSAAAASPLQGNRENTDVGAFLAAYLDLDLAQTTTDLRQAAKEKYSGNDEPSWRGKSVDMASTAANPEVYSGDFSEEHHVVHRRGHADCQYCHAV